MLTHVAMYAHELYVIVFFEIVLTVMVSSFLYLVPGFL